MSWFNEAACKSAYEAFYDDYDTKKFVDNGVLAKLLCNVCPVRGQCFDYSFDFYDRPTEPSGIWGGYKPSERRKIAKKFDASREDFYADIYGGVNRFANGLISGFEKKM